MYFLMPYQRIVHFCFPPCTLCPRVSLYSHQGKKASPVMWSREPWALKEEELVQHIPS